MSVYWDILMSIKQRLVGVMGDNHIKVRKRAIYLESDTLPTIIISPAAEKIDLEAFNRQVAYSYTVQVTLVQAGNRLFEQDVRDWLLLRQQIRQALYQPTLPDIDNVIGMELDMQPAFETVTGNTSNYDVSGMSITYQILEERTT